MPRPRKDQEGLSAVERMEEAFWNALAEKPYAKMTVGDIAQRAQVNKNASYHQYSRLYALAERRYRQHPSARAGAHDPARRRPFRHPADALAATAPEPSSSARSVSGSSPARTAQASSPRC